MMSENYTTTYIKASPSYRSRPIFSTSPQPQTMFPSNQMSYNMVQFNPAPPQFIEEQRKSTNDIVYDQNIDPDKELMKLNLRIKILEKEKNREEKEKISQSELINTLKSHNRALEDQLKVYILQEQQGSTNELDDEVFKRLHEQEELFHRKEKLFEEERTQLLRVLSSKDALTAEVQEDKQKEHEFALEDLERQIEEKQLAYNQITQENSRISQMMEELRKASEKEKDEALSAFEVQKQSLEEKITRILEDNEKVVIFNNGLLKEIETLRGLNKGLEDKHAAHLEEIRSNFRTQTEKTQFALKSNFEIERTSMDNQIIDLKSYSAKMQEKFDDVLNENQNLRIEKETIETEANNRVADVEEKIMNLLDKNQDLLALIEVYKGDIEELKRKINEISNENLDYVIKFKEESEKTILAEQALEKNENKYLTEIEELKSNKLRLDVHIQDLEHKILDLLADNEKLNGALLDRIKENELLKISFTNVKVLNEKNHDLQEKIELNNANMRNLEEKFEKLLSENSKLNQVFEKTYKDLEISKGRVMILETELEAKMKVYIYIMIIYIYLMII